MPQPSVYDFIPTIETQRGDRYVFGAEARFSDPNPHAFDCSELIEWGLARVGVAFTDGAANQFRYCQTHHTVIPVAQGVVTWGALLFRITPPHNHVAVSLGNGQTFEARGAAYGVNTFESLGRRWTAAALIPGLDYSQQRPPIGKPPVGPTTPLPVPPEVEMFVYRESNKPTLKLYEGKGRIRSGLTPPIATDLLNMLDQRPEGPGKERKEWVLSKETVAWLEGDA